MSNRRDFIKKLSLIALSSTALSNWSFANYGKKIPLGIQLYTLKDVIHKDVKSIIEAISKMGYVEVETFNYSKVNGFFGMKTKDFASLLSDNGIKAVSGHYEFGNYFANKNNNQVAEAIEASALLDSKYVTIPWLDSPIRKSIDDYKRVAEKLNLAGEQTKKAGMQIAYHNHEFEFKNHSNTFGLKILLEETDPKLVTFELDLFWLIYAGHNPIEFIKAYPNRFKMWHLKDMSYENKNLNTEIGNGKLPVQELFRIANSSGLKHCFVEQETNYKPNELDSVSLSARFIKSLQY